MFGNILQQLQKVRSQLEGLLRNGAYKAEIRNAMDKLNELSYKEEMLWLQMS